MAVTAAELMVIVRADTRGAETGLSALDKRIRQLAAGGMLLGLGRSMVGFVTDLVTAGAEFEAQLILVDQLAGGTGNRIEELKRLAFELDQQMIFGSQEVIDAMEQLAREGFSHTQMLEGHTEAALNFAGAIKEDVTQAANFYGIAARVFQEEGLAAADIADILTAAVLRSGRPLAEMATGFQYVGGAAAQLGIPLEDTANALAFLGAQGIKVRSAGTGLRTMFLELADPGVREELAALGITVLDMEGNFVGLTPLIEDFGQALAGMSDMEALNFLEGIFGKHAASPLLALFRGGLDAWDEFLKKIEAVPDAADIMEARMDSVAGSLDRLGATWLNLKRLMGDSASGFFRPIIDGFTAFLDMLQNLPTRVLGAITVLTALTGALFLLGGAITLFSALGGFGLMATALGALLSPAVLVAAAVVGLAVVFRDQLGGVIQTVAGHVDDFIRRFFALYDLFRDLGQGPVPAALNAFAATLRATFGIDIVDQVQRFIEVFRGIGTAVSEAVDTLRTVGFSEAIGVLSANLQGVLSDGVRTAIVNALEFVDDHVVDTIVRGLRDGFAALQDLGFDESLGVLAANLERTLGADLTAAVVNGLQAARDALDRNWRGMFGNIGGLVANVASWTLNVVAPTVVNLLGNVGQWIFERLRQATPVVLGFAAWTWGIVAPLAWSGIESAGAWLRDKLVAAAPLVADFAEWSWSIADANSWVIVDVARWIRDKLVAAAPVVSAFAEWTWDVAAPAVWTGVTNAWVWLKTQLIALAPVVSAFSQWTWDVAAPATWTGLDAVVSALGEALAGAVTDAVDFGSGIKDALTTKIVDAFSGITGMDVYQAGVKVGDALRSAIIAAVQNFDEAMLDIASAINTALLNLTWSDVFLPAELGFKVMAAVALAITGGIAGFVLGEETANALGVKVQAAFTEGIESIEGFFSPIWDAIVASFEAPSAETFAELGKTIAMALWAAIVAGASGIGNLADLMGSFFSGDPNMPEPIGNADPSQAGDNSGAIPIIDEDEKGGGNRRHMPLAMPENPFAPIVKAAQDAVLLVVAEFDKIEERMGVFVAQATAFSTAAGERFNALLSTGLGLAVASTNLFLSVIEERMGVNVSQATAFATAAGTNFNARLSAGLGTAVASANLFLSTIEVRMGTHVAQATAFGTAAGSQFNALLSTGLGTAVASANTFLAAIEGRMGSFVGQTAAAALQAGTAWFTGANQGFQHLQGAAVAHINALVAIVSVNLAPYGYNAGASYSFAVADGLRAGLPAIYGAVNEINAAVGAAQAGNAQLAAELNTARQLSNATP